MILGGLHIEMTIINMLGKWLDRSFQTSAVVEVGIAVHVEGQQHFFLLLM